MISYLRVHGHLVVILLSKCLIDMIFDTLSELVNSEQCLYNDDGMPRTAALTAAAACHQTEMAEWVVRDAPTYPLGRRDKSEVPLAPLSFHPLLGTGSHQNPGQTSS
jgi:hypothetical protein